MPESVKKIEYYPMRLTAGTKSYLWGGGRLYSRYGKGAPDGKTAESWELSAHPDGLSVIAEGAYAGRTIAELGKEDRALFWGKRCADTEFPLLVKLIDAEKDLSVQVHPPEERARRERGERGKTEMWYVLDAEPESAVYLGFSEPMTGELLREKTGNGTITQYLRRFPAKRGDVFFIPAGTVHAIGAGLLLAEIQQSSNTTFRVYDYHRRGADGKERPLHLERAIEVIELTPGGGTALRGETIEDTAEYTRTGLAACRCFETEKIDIRTALTRRGDGESFVHFLCTEGNAVIECGKMKYDARAGDSFFLPAAIGEYTVSGASEWIVTRMGKDG